LGVRNFQQCELLVSFDLLATVVPVSAGPWALNPHDAFEELGPLFLHEGFPAAIDFIGVEVDYLQIAADGTGDNGDARGVVDGRVTIPTVNVPARGTMGGENLPAGF
jgi:hypothetical protein